jgi:hypothetical protein
MKKISTLYRKNPENLGLVVNIVNKENQWVFKDGIATRKFDGSACAIINGELFKRYDVKKGRQIPENAIPCQEADEITGHHPHWIKCDREKPEDKYFFEGLDGLGHKENGTYELVGEKVQGNPEKIEGHHLMKHGMFFYANLDLSFEGLKKFLEKTDIEGIVFHHKEDGRMCKIRKSDFGIKR